MPKTHLFTKTLNIEAGTIGEWRPGTTG